MEGLFAVHFDTYGSSTRLRHSAPLSSISSIEMADNDVDIGGRCTSDISMHISYGALVNLVTDEDTSGRMDADFASKSIP